MTIYRTTQLIEKGRDWDGQNICLRGQLLQRFEEYVLVPEPNDVGPEQSSRTLEVLISVAGIDDFNPCLAQRWIGQAVKVRGLLDYGSPEHRDLWLAEILATEMVRID